MWTRAGPILAAAVLMQLAAVAAAHARPCLPIGFGEPHVSLEEAATRTLRALFFAGEPYESGGFLIEKNGAFRASKPVTQRSRNTVNYCIVVPRGARLAGLYHTHVANPVLSPRDRGNAERAGVPSYVGTIRDGSLFVYDARGRKTRVIGNGSTSDDLVAASLTSRTSLAGRLAAVRQRVPALLSDAGAALETWGRAARQALFTPQD
jgi:hypothetical protein